LIEGAGGLVSLGALSVFIISLPKGQWATALPVALVFPLLLWVAVRCRPVFAAAAAFIVGLAIIWSTTFNLGHFGDESIPLADRVLTAQTFVLAGALLTIILAALFADRRRSEAELKQSKERLQLALDGAELGAFSADTAGSRLECDGRAAQIHGHNVPPTTIKQWRRFVHPDDLLRIDAALEESRRTGSVWNAEYRVMQPPDHPHAGETHWVAVEGSTLFDIRGTPVGLFGVTRDITQRKQAEQALTERNIQLALAAKAGLVGSYAYDADTEIMRISPGYAAIHGFPEGTVEIARSECLAGVHPEDIGRVKLARSEAFRKQQREYSVEYRIIRAGEFRWVETRCFISYQSDRHPTQVIGVSIDITERKRAEQTLAERDAQLELAQKAARVGCYTYDAIAGTMRFSRASGATYGPSQNTIELTAQQWLARVHRDDVQRLRAEHIRAFKNRQSDLVEEFRVVQEGGEVRWIEARSIISYNHAGRAERMTGVYIDVTERRKAEDQKTLLIAELDHRVKNVLACVAAVAQRTRECSKSPDEFLEELNGRINSLANTHALLSRSQWQGVGVSKLVRSELAFCANGQGVLIEGPEVELAAEAVQPVAMVLHELVTNAAKYGALSDGRGQIAIRWRRQSNGGTGGKLVLEWRETGGPPVAAPNATGYGTTVIRDLIPFELGGAVDYELAREGARCRLVIPAKWLTKSSRVDVIRHAYSDPLSRTVGTLPLRDSDFVPSAAGD
jgi:PAS domain S-box-containing protein